MDEIAEAKKQVKLRNWQMMYSEYQASGKAVRRWCAEQNLSTKTFYYRLRKLREAVIKQEQHEIVLVKACDEETHAPTANASTIRITSRGITAELPQDISPELLTALLKGLSSC